MIKKKIKKTLRHSKSLCTCTFDSTCVIWLGSVSFLDFEPCKGESLSWLNPFYFLQWPNPTYSAQPAQFSSSSSSVPSSQRTGRLAVWQCQNKLFDPVKVKEIGYKFHVQLCVNMSRGSHRGDCQLNILKLLLLYWYCSNVYSKIVQNCVLCNYFHSKLGSLIIFNFTSRFA